MKFQAMEVQDKMLHTTLTYVCRVVDICKISTSTKFSQVLKMLVQTTTWLAIVNVSIL
jgi:hypothetical protein